MTLAIPLYNIYAFSYNTLAMGIIATVLAELFVWHRGAQAFSPGFWTLAIVLLLVAYPPLGVGMAAIVMARLLLEQDHACLRRFVLSLGGGIAVAAMVMLQFATSSDYARSIAFTRAFSLEPQFSSSVGICSFLYG